MTPDETQAAGAVGACRLDILTLTHDKHGGARHARGARRVGDGQREDDVGERWPHCSGDGNGQQDGGERHQRVHDRHESGIESREEACDGADQRTRHTGDDRDRQADQQRDTRAEYDTAEHVAAETIGAKPFQCGRWLQPAGDLHLVGIGVRDGAGQQCQQQDAKAQQRSGNEKPVAQQAREQRKPPCRGQARISDAHLNRTRGSMTA